MKFAPDVKVLVESSMEEINLSIDVNSYTVQQYHFNFGQGCIL